MSKFIGQCVIFFFAACATWANAEQAAIPIYQVSDVQGTFIQVPLTRDIYRYARHPNLHDLHVLDADKNVLPYQLIQVSSKPKKTEPTILTEAVAFFPVAPDTPPDALRSLHINQTIVHGDKVRVATSDRVLDNKTPEFYLIDIRKIDYTIEGLDIDWSAQTNNQYLEIELESTQNLHDWIFLARATLVQLNQQENQLKHNQIKVDVDKKEYEFLRLKILRGAEQLNITNIMASQKIHRVDEPISFNESWSTFGQLANIQDSVYSAGTRNKRQAVAAWEFSRDEAAPLETVSIDLGSHIYGDEVKIFSRATESNEWHLLYQGIWFNAQVGEKWQTSEPLEAQGNNNKFWRVELNASAKSYNPPALIFSWKPLQLQFIASSKPPFFLAISHEYSPGNNNQKVFNKIVSAASSPAWVAANLLKLSNEPKFDFTEVKSIEWRKWIFWSALIAAVIILLIFSVKLFKQLKISELSQ